MPSEIICRAAEAGRDAVKTYDETLGPLRVALAALSDASTRAAIRSLLTDLRDLRFEVIHGALREDVVHVSDLDVLLREVDHAE